MGKVITVRHRRLRWSVKLAAMVLVVLPAWSSLRGGERVVAIGDVHGSYKGLVTILVRSGLLDAGGHWNGGSQVLVQTGDLFDRGAQVRPVLDLLTRLQAEATASGGRVIVLLGNHEAMNLMGLESYVNPAVYEAFAGRGSRRALKRAYAQRARFWEHRAPELGIEVPAGAVDKEVWLGAHPQGWVEYRAALGPGGELGRWLHGLPAVVVVGGTLFVHGGLGPTVRGMDVESINRHVAGELATFWQARSEMESEQLVPPLASLAEMILGARAAPGRDEREPASARDHRLLEEVLHARTWFLLDPEGPLWYGGQANGSDGEVGSKTVAALDALGVHRMVAGHTPSQDGRIHVRFGGRVFLIDTGMLSEVYAGGRPSALEIRGETVTAIYPEERVHLVGPDGPSHLTGLGGHPELLDADGRPLSLTSKDEILELLRTGRVTWHRGIGRGINENYQLLLEKDGLRVHAAYRVVDREADLPVGSKVEMLREYGGSVRDRAIYEAAAYEMSRILGIHRVPPAVERGVEEIRRRGRAPRSTVQLWLEHVSGEKDRRLRGVVSPDPDYERQQLQTMYLFDNIIGNIDRTQENLLVDRNWKLWFIDHTRSFIKSAKLVNPEEPTRCERQVWRRLTSLDEQDLRRRLEPYLERTEINFVLVRWHKMIEILRARIEANGEGAVLFDLKDISRSQVRSEAGPEELKPAA